MKKTNRFVNYYCATWLIILEWSFKVWGTVMRHCLSLKGIDHKSIEFRKPNLGLIFANELSVHLEAEIPYTLDFIREQAAKDSEQVLNDLAEKLRLEHQRAQKNLGTFEPKGVFNVARFHRKLDGVISDEEKADYAKERLARIEKQQGVFTDMSDAQNAEVEIKEENFAFPTEITAANLKEALSTLKDYADILEKTEVQSAKSLDERIFPGITSLKNEFVDKLTEVGSNEFVSDEQIKSKFDKAEEFAVNLNEPTDAKLFVDIASSIPQVETTPIVKEKSELDLARNTKRIKDKGAEQIKRQVKATDKRTSKQAKTSKSRIRPQKKVSKSSKK